MKKEITFLFAIFSILFTSSCATSQKTVQQIDQHDDVYYSIAQAKEQAEVIAQVKPENKSKAEYVTDEELYRDYYGNSSGEYVERIYRFRNYTPWRGYYNSYYNNSFNSYSYYDPFYSPNSFYGNSNINIFVGMDNGYFNYNPWRYYGNNYSNNFWGPYSYNRSFNPYGVGFGGGNFYGSGYGDSRPGSVSPNYRRRPTRSSDNIPTDRGDVNNGAARSVTKNGNVIQPSGTRSERYNGGNSTSGSSGNSRPQATAPRPERVQQAEPQRSAQPERVNSTPSNNNGGGSPVARPSRAN